MLASLALSRPLPVGAANTRPVRATGSQAAGGQTADIDLAAGRYEAVALAELVVTKAADTDDGTCDADCSLREAIAAAAAAGDTIVFAGGLAGQTIPLGSQLVISKILTIDGSSLGAPVQISGQNAVRVFNVTSSGVVTLSALHIISGTATDDEGGGIYNRGQLTVTNSTLSGNSANYGGGIVNYGRLTLQNSTLSGNSAAKDGGGIGNGGTLTVQNSTLSGNSAAEEGGGIYNTGMLTVQNSTLSGNSAAKDGGGISNDRYGTLNYENTIIANSASGEDCYNNITWGSTIGVNAHNLVEDGSCSDGAVDFLTGDPMLGPLASNGPSTSSGQAPSAGSGQAPGTLTHALAAGSPAIDAVPLVSCTVSTDQRGFPRPYPAGGACDIGAYEAGPLRLAKIATPATGAPYHGLVTYTLVLSNTGGTDDPSVWLTDTLPAEVTFDSWGIQPVNATRDGDEIRWQGDLAAGQAVSLSFRARHTGEYNDHVVNLAQFSGASDRGWGYNGFNAECLPIYTVQNANDAGTGSLRQAVVHVCSGGRILFGGDLSITLNSELAIARQLTIDGEGHAITISGNNAVRVFKVETSGVVTLSALNIVSGTVTGDNGGGIINEGQLMVQDCTLSGNSADWNGGGIYNATGGRLTVQKSILFGNTTINDHGGGIANHGQLTVTNSTLSYNSADWVGGGIHNAGPLTMMNSTLSNNSAGSGGGIYNINMLTMTNSTLSGNSTGWAGGGIYNNGQLTVTNSTFSGNSSVEAGGGIANYEGRLNYENTIVANSTSGGDCYNTWGGTIGTNTHNLVEDGSCSDGAIDFLTGDPMLDSLADNGGPSTGSGQATNASMPLLTHALLPGSMAIDAVPLVSCTVSTDQRGFSRPYPAGGACDIGAYEAGPLRLAKTATPATSAPFTDGAPYHGLVTYTLVLSNTSGMDDPSVWLTDTLPAEVTFDSWVLQPANATLAGDEVRWQGSLAAGQMVSLSFRVRHTGEYNDHVVNLARFSSTLDFGSGQAGFDVACTPTYTVQNANDTGAGSLRQAIVGVCPGGRILFGGDFNITLGSELAIAKQLTIDGEGHSITISGDNAVRACAIGAGGVVTLSALRIVSGTAYNGGGIVNEGRLTMQNSTLSGNSATEGGGGIYNNGQLTVTNSTLSGNSADWYGGGIHNYSGTLTVTNSTLSGNSAPDGGGIANWDMLTLQNSTLSDNSGSGINNNAHSMLNYENTIIANNAIRDCYNNGSIGVNSHNLVEDGSCSDGAVGFLTGDPQLAPLADNALASNGGPSTGSGQAPWTHALLPNSPAIDAGNPVGGETCPSTDQRGLPRDDLRCDIGAFELRFSDSDTVIKSGFAGGTPYSFGPTWISLTLPITDTGSITITKHLTYPGGIADAGEMPATWRITSTLATGLPLTLSLCYTDAEIAGLNEASLRAFRWDGLQWTVPVSTGLTVDEATNCVTLRGIEQFSPWTLKDISQGSGSPTAVTLREFSAGAPYALPLLGALVLLGALALVRRRK